VKDRVPGESLWGSWDDPEGGIAYITRSHGDCRNEVVGGALASRLQRDGVVDSLAERFSAVQAADSSLCWVGAVGSGRDHLVCDKDGVRRAGTSSTLH
jgi:hypothetical protein